MNATAIRLILNSPTANYQPQEPLTGRYSVEGSGPWLARAVELSVLWYTAGQGEEDMAIHHFERLVDDSARPLDLRAPRRFSTILPASPFSYDGRIVKVCWCVRLRLFLPHGQETLSEVPFHLGNTERIGDTTK